MSADRATCPDCGQHPKAAPGTPCPRCGAPVEATERKTYSVRSTYFDVTGPLFPCYYAGDRWVLALGEPGAGMPEVLSVNLIQYDIEQPDGYVHVGTYSQYAGLPEALEEAGMATKVGDAPVTFGGHDASAWLMKLSDEIVAQFEEWKASLHV